MKKSYNDVLYLSGNATGFYAPQGRRLQRRHHDLEGARRPRRARPRRRARGGQGAHRLPQLGGPHRARARRCSCRTAGPTTSSPPPRRCACTARSAPRPARASRSSSATSGTRAARTTRPSTSAMQRAGGRVLRRLPEGRGHAAARTAACSPTRRPARRTRPAGGRFTRRELGAAAPEDRDACAAAAQQRISSSGGNPATAQAIDPIGGAGCVHHGPGRARQGHGRGRAALPQAVHDARPADRRRRGSGRRAAAASSPRGSGTCTAASRCSSRAASTGSGTTSAARSLFQLFGNGWRFAQGHTAKLELLGQRPQLPAHQQLQVLGRGVPRLGWTCRAGDRGARQRRRGRARLRDDRRPRRPAAAARDGARDAADPLGPRAVRGARRARLPRDPLRQPRRGAARRRSTRPVPNVMRRDGRLPDRARPTCSSDMADDSFGLLDQLGIERAHVVGVSMGGMIAQTMAIRRPERVLSLGSMMSTTGRPARGHAEAARVERPDAARAAGPRRLHRVLRARVPDDRLARATRVDEARMRERPRPPTTAATTPPARRGSSAAILASGSRTAALRRAGRADRGDPREGRPARAVPRRAWPPRRAIPGAELVAFPGMGHDLPRELWPTLHGRAREERGAGATSPAGLTSPAPVLGRQLAAPRRQRRSVVELALDELVVARVLGEQRVAHRVPVGAGALGRHRAGHLRLPREGRARRRRAAARR